MNDQLLSRVRRIYAAIGETVETDMRRLQAYVLSTDKIKGFFQDFSGGKSPEQLENTIQGLIAIIASFEYHLRQWASHNGKDPEHVTNTFRNSRPLQIVHDLWNNEKHAYPKQHGKERSGVGPKLVHVNRTMRLTTQAKKGSWVMMTAGLNGAPIIQGDGSAKVVTTADILDRDGNKIGDAHETLVSAVTECETFLSAFGVRL